MKDINILLCLLFLAIVLFSWLVLLYSIKGFTHYESRFKLEAENNLEKMFLFFDYKKIFLINTVGIVLIPIAIYLFTNNLFYTALSLVAFLSTPKIMLKLLQARRKKKISEDLPDSLSQIAGGLRSGSTLVSAIEAMVYENKGPVGQEFSLLLKEQKVGIKPEEALENLAERVKSEDVDLVVTAALIAREVGGNLAETFERLSIMLRRKVEMEGKIKALTSQGKLQGWVVGLLPFAIMFALTIIEPDAIGPIFTTVLGWIFIAIILFLEILGAVFIKKIVSIDI